MSRGRRTATGEWHTDDGRVHTFKRPLEAGEPPPQETHPEAYDLALGRLCRRYGLGNTRVGLLMFWVGAGLLATGVWLLIGAGIQVARQKKPKPL